MYRPAEGGRWASGGGGDEQFAVKKSAPDRGQKTHEKKPGGKKSGRLYADKRRLVRILTTPGPGLVAGKGAKCRREREPSKKA